MILKSPFDKHTDGTQNSDERDQLIIEKARTMKPFINSDEFELAREIFEKSYRESLKSNSPEEAMLDAATDIWLIARLLSDRFGTPIKPKRK